MPTLSKFQKNLLIFALVANGFSAFRGFEPSYLLIWIAALLLVLPDQVIGKFRFAFGDGRWMRSHLLVVLAIASVCCLYGAIVVGPLGVFN